jgi:predicted ester cyclase
MSVHADAARLVLQSFADGEVDVLDQLHTPDHIEHSPLPGQSAVGAAGLRERAMVISCAFYDSKVSAEILVDNDDIVVLQARCRGVHKGDFYGIAPTGRQVEAVGLCVFRFVDGRVAESWSSFAVEGLLDAAARLHGCDETTPVPIDLERSLA